MTVDGSPSMSSEALPRIPPGLSVIDTHLHIWDTTAPWMAWLPQRPAAWDVVRRNFSWQELRGVLDGAGVPRLVLVQAGTSVDETRSLLRFAADQDSVVGVVGWVTLSSGAATEADLGRLETTGHEKLVGVRSLHRWEPDGDILGSRKVLESCSVLADRGLPLDLFFNTCGDLPLAISLAEGIPSLPLVIDHLGRPPIGSAGAWDSWASSMATLSEFPQVHVKYSGWATDIGRVKADDVRPYIDFVLEKFGSSRVMYGGNWPVSLVAGGYQQTYEASLRALDGLAPADLANVLAETATRYYLASTSTQVDGARLGEQGGGRI